MRIPYAKYALRTVMFTLSLYVFLQNCWPRSLFGERFQKMSAKDVVCGEHQHQQNLPISGMHNMCTM